MRKVLAYLARQFANSSLDFGVGKQNLYSLRASRNGSPTLNRVWLFLRHLILDVRLTLSHAANRIKPAFIGASLSVYSGEIYCR